jgi:wobble nucleotide-excising tRNase
MEDTIAELQAEMRGLSEQLSRIEQCMFMIEVDATELEMEFKRRIAALQMPRELS